MTANATRLERLIEQEVGSCCDGDVHERLTALAEYTEQPTDRRPDLTALGTLGNETRYTIARLLASADEELCVCEITPVVDVSESAVSHALADLRAAGLVTRRKEGTWRYYAATERTHALLDALDATRGDQ